MTKGKDLLKDSIQAVVLADSFNVGFVPLTYELPQVRQQAPRAGGRGARAERGASLRVRDAPQHAESAVVPRRVPVIRPAVF